MRSSVVIGCLAQFIIHCARPLSKSYGGYITGGAERHFREPTAEDAAALRRNPETGGLTVCRGSGEWRGFRPAPTEPSKVHQVHCRCDNDTRCAVCGAPFAEGRLDAYCSVRREVWFYAGFSALSHRCGGGRWFSDHVGN